MRDKQGSMLPRVLAREAAIRPKRGYRSAGAKDGESLTDAPRFQLKVVTPISQGTSSLIKSTHSPEPKSA
jgi:hypothetical protein